MNDPLLKIGPQKVIELFQSYQRASNGRDIDDIVCAAGNLIVDCIRQECDSKHEAVNYFDTVIRQLKSGLTDHYTNYGKIIDVTAYPKLPEITLKGLINE